MIKRKGANSIPMVIGTDKSDYKLYKIVFLIVKALLIYRVSFFISYIIEIINPPVITPHNFLINF